MKQYPFSKIKKNICALINFNKKDKQNWYLLSLLDLLSQVQRKVYDSICQQYSYNTRLMISGIIRKVLPCVRNCRKFYQLTHVPKGCFSRAIKFNEVREALSRQIDDQTKEMAELSKFEKLFKSQGWKLKQQNILVQLFKRVDDYDVRLLSNIRASINFVPEGSEILTSWLKSDKQMNQVTICITKLGSFRTMGIDTLVTNGYEITNMKFAENYEYFKEHRLDLNINNRYKGPQIETLPEQLFEGISTFLTDQLGVTNDIMEGLAEYCLDVEQKYYINWLKDLKNVF